MEKIPTVEKFLTSKGLPGFAAHTTIKHHMIEFAKLHIENFADNFNLSTDYRNHLVENYITNIK